MARDEKGHFLPGNKEGRRIGAPDGLPTAIMTILGNEGKKRKKELEDIMEKITQRMTFSPILDEDTKKQLEENFNVSGQDAVRFHKIVKGLVERAEAGDPRAIETLLKIAGLYVEKSETKSESVVKAEFTNLEDWKEYVKGLNE